LGGKSETWRPLRTRWDHGGRSDQLTGVEAATTTVEEAATTAVEEAATTTPPVPVNQINLLVALLVSGINYHGFYIQQQKLANLFTFSPVLELVIIIQTMHLSPRLSDN
jgi:hypothetical protein